nr:hypothetical protein [Tanacetum cinerariifolium]
DRTVWIDMEGKVYVVRAKEVTGWVSDFGEENSDKSEDYSDNNSVGKKSWVKSKEGEIIPESVQNDAFIDNIAESKPINGDSRENQSGQHILKPSNHPSGDPFGLDDLIHSMAGPVKQRNGFSILERFQKFIDIGEAMGYKMKGAWGSEEKAVGKETLSFES